MRLFIQILICFQVAGIAVSSGKSCVYQVKTRIVQSGGSVIIPCSYNNPQGLGKEEEIDIHWSEANETCLFDRDAIPLEKVAEKYDGRLFIGKDPNRNRTHYLEITGLKKTDGPLFCCQIVNKQNPQNVWKSQYGTLLQFPDQGIATQLNELIAVPDEDIVIPCHYPKSLINSVEKVTWYRVQSKSQICGPDGRNVHTSDKQQQDDQYSLVNYPRNVSLRIRNTNNQIWGDYCCDILTNTKRKILSKQVTTLLVAEYQSSWDQLTNEILVQEGHSATLTCSHTLPGGQYTERDVVRVNVYWRVGNVTGPYAYHPYQEMVYSSYLNRTNITGIANLHIKGVKTEDNTTFHCFVVFKLCNGDNQYEDKIVYGGNTRLNVEGHIPSGSQTKETPTLPISIIIIIITSAIIMIVIILILIVLKVKGVLCKKENISKHLMNPIQDPGKGNGSSKETGYHETSSKKPDEVPVVGMDNLGRTVEDEDDKLLYAKLDETKLNDKSRAQRPKHSEEVVYADVVNAAQI